MLARRLRRRSNIKPTLGQCLVYAGLVPMRENVNHSNTHVQVRLKYNSLDNIYHVYGYHIFDCKTCHFTSVQLTGPYNIQSRVFLKIKSPLCHSWADGRNCTPQSVSRCDEIFGCYRKVKKYTPFYPVPRHARWETPACGQLF